MNSSLISRLKAVANKNIDILKKILETKYYFCLDRKFYYQNSPFLIYGFSDLQILLFHLDDLLSEMKAREEKPVIQ